MKKSNKLLALVLTLLLLLPLCSCGEPSLDTVKDRFTELIENSYAINEIFFGAGLPTYEREGDFAKEHRIYDDLENGYDLYEMIVPDEAYPDVQSIKDAAGKVYSADYLSDICTMAFDGYADSTTGQVITARYLETEHFFLRYAYGETDSFNLLKGKQRRYLFDTMKITRPSSAKSVNLSIDSYLIGDEDNILNVTLRFVKQNGEWLLDSPTY